MIQIRNVPDDLHRTLKIRAAQEGLSLSDYLLREIEKVAGRPTVSELLSAIAADGRGVAFPERAAAADVGGPGAASAMRVGLRRSIAENVVGSSTRNAIAFGTGSATGDCSSGCQLRPRSCAQT